MAKCIRADDIIGVIPARWGSARFPGKMVAPIAGRPLLEWIIRGCKRSERVKRWIVATDDGRIADVARRSGAEVAMTSSRIRSGSDRAAAVVAHQKARWVVNWQGDEWLPNGRPVDTIVAALESHPGCDVATLARPMAAAEKTNANRVKVVLSQSGRALYFSRSPIPHDSAGSKPTLLHIGAYAFSKSMLLQFSAWTPTPLEKQEKLEQLRLLEHDVPVAVGICRTKTFGIDTPADARGLEKYLTKRRS